MDRHAQAGALLVSELNSHILAIAPSRLAAVREFARLHATGQYGDGHGAAPLGMEYDEESSRQSPNKMAGIAVLPLSGILFPEPNIITAIGWGTALSEFARAYRLAVADQSVAAIAVKINSPGGLIYGGEELWSDLFAMRKAKRAVAVVNHFCGSMAFWVGSAIEEIVAAPSGELGGVGCYMIWEGIARALDKEGIDVDVIFSGEHKVEHSPFQVKLSGEARAHTQSQVDACKATFVKCVARGRGVSTTEVEKRYGQGRMLLARDAVAAGMADRLGTLEDTVAKLSGRKANGGARAVAIQTGTYVESLSPSWTAADDAPPAEIPLTPPADPEPEPIAEPEPAVALAGAGVGEIERRRRELELRKLG